VRDAVRQILTGHEPYPAVVVDRGWHLLDANRAVSVLTDLVAPALLVPPVNVLRASLHPDGLAPHILNLAEWRAHLLGRLRGQVEITADPELAALHAELSAYPGGDGANGASAPDQLVVPLRVSHGARTLSFLSTVATFGTPVDITVAELSMESFYPADQATAATLRALGGDQATAP
jgi:hypothetical protein